MAKQYAVYLPSKYKKSYGLLCQIGVHGFEKYINIYPLLWLRAV